MLERHADADVGQRSLRRQPLGRWQRRDLARRIAIVPQETHAPFDFTVLDIVLMGRFPHLGHVCARGSRGSGDRAAGARVHRHVGLRGSAVRTLSGGEKQRVVIASALAQSPELLLLDEPTASLDLGHQIDVQLLLARLNRDRGVTMVLSTHDLNLAAALCRDLILLRGGRVIAQGPTEDVLTPEAVRALYGVDADVTRHPIAGHLTVMPLARVPLMPSIRARLVADAGRVSACCSPRRSSTGPLDRIDAHLARPRRSIGRFRSPTTPTRRFSSSPGCRACSRRRSSARRWRRRAWSSRRCCGTRSPRPTRSASPAAPRSARCWPSPCISTSRSPASPRFRSPASPDRSARWAIVYALASARRRGLSTIVLLLAGVTMTAFFSALILFTQYLADFTETFRTVRWLMGTLDVGSYAPILAALPILLVAFAMLATLAALARSDQPRRRCRRRARRQRRCAAERLALVERVARHRSGGVARPARSASSASSCRTSSA